MVSWTVASRGELSGQDDDDYTLEKDVHFLNFLDHMRCYEYSNHNTVINHVYALMNVNQATNKKDSFGE